MSKRFIAALYFALASIGAFFVGPAPQAAAQECSQYDANYTCPSCDDMACWRCKTASASRAQFDCAFNALSAAAAISSGGTTTTATFLAGIAQMANALLAPIPGDPDVNGHATSSTLADWFGYVGNICSPQSNVLNDLVSKFGNTEGNRIAACFSRTVQATNQACAAFGQIKALIDPQLPVSDKMNQVLAGLSIGMSYLQAGWQLLAAVDACYNGKLTTKLTEMIGGSTQSFNAIMGIITAAQCGLTIAQGTTILLHNSYCLGRDLAALYQSNQQVTAAVSRLYPTDGTAVHPCVRAGTCTSVSPTPVTTVAPPMTPGGPVVTQPVATVVPSPSAATCGWEPNGCSQWAMGLLGSRLWQTNLITTSRSTYCGQNCGNRGGGGECSKFAPALFASQPACQGICGTAQCDAAIDRCVSMCCGQNGACVTDTHNKMNRNGWK